MLLAGFCHYAFSQNIVTITKEELARKAVSESILERRVGFLSYDICQGRATGSAGAAAASFYISSAMRAAGMRPLGDGWAHSFLTKDGKAGHNMVGFIPGSELFPPNSYVLITAYYDGLGILDGTLYPGADSNASGVAAMLSLGDMMRSMLRIDESYRKSVIFAALDAKYSGMGGSEALYGLIASGGLKDPVSGKTIKPSDIDLVLNLDQLGSTEAPIHEGRKDYMILLGAEGYRRSLADFVNERKDFPLGLDLGYDYYGSSSFTRIFYRTYGDQKVFLENGIPAIMATSGITMRNNKPSDNSDSIDYTILKKRIWLLFHWLERIL